MLISQIPQHFLAKNISVFGYKVVKHLTSWPIKKFVRLTMLWTNWPQNNCLVYQGNGWSLTLVMCPCPLPLPQPCSCCILPWPCCILPLLLWIYLHIPTHKSNSYTMVCPPVWGDNPPAVASGLSPHTDGHYTIDLHLYEKVCLHVWEISHQQ